MGLCMDDVLQKIADPELRLQVARVAPFHGYLSTGAFIGIQMLSIARRVLGAGADDRLFTTCETYNCLPDPFQVLAGCTIGNKGLKIENHGKMAVTVTRRAPAGSSIKGVRIVLDPAKTVSYPRLHAWYMKTDKVPHPEAISILIDAGEIVYTYRVIDLVVPEKPRKQIAICDSCKESFVQKENELLCVPCFEKSRRLIVDAQ